jgi:hypothetical protein
VDVSGQSLLPLMAILAIAMPGVLFKVFGGGVLLILAVLAIVRFWLRREHPKVTNPGPGSSRGHTGGHRA